MPSSPAGPRWDWLGEDAARGVLPGDSFSALTFAVKPARKTTPDIVKMKNDREGLVVGEMDGDKIWPKLRVAQQRAAGRGGAGGAAPHLRGARARGRVAGACPGRGLRGGAMGGASRWRRRLEGGGVALGGGTGPGPEARRALSCPSRVAPRSRRAPACRGRADGAAGPARPRRALFLFHFPSCEAGALAGEERRRRRRPRVGTRRAGGRPRGRDSGAPAKLWARRASGTGPSRHLPRPGAPGPGDSSGGGGGRPGFGGFSGGLPFGAERAAGCGRRAGGVGRPPQRSAGGQAACPRGRHLRGGRGGLSVGRPRTYCRSRRGWTRKSCCRPCAVTARPASFLPWGPGCGAQDLHSAPGPDALPLSENFASWELP